MHLRSVFAKLLDDQIFPNAVELFGVLNNPLGIYICIGDLFEGIVAATTSTLTTAAENSFRDLLASALSWTSVLANTGK